MIYIRTKTGEFKKYFRQGIIGIILAACVICCFIVARNFELPNKEEVAVSSYIPGERIDIDILNPDTASDILNKNLSRSPDPVKTSELPEIHVTDVATERTGAAKAVKEDPKQILPVVQSSPIAEPRDEAPANTVVPDKDPEVVIPFTYTGTLPMDY